jgi:hypothetical protein
MPPFERLGREILFVTGANRLVLLNRADRATWWAREDLNLRPHAYQARALTN